MYQTQFTGTAFCVYFYQRKTEQKEIYQGIQFQNWINEQWKLLNAQLADKGKVVFPSLWMLHKKHFIYTSVFLERWWYLLVSATISQIILCYWVYEVLAIVTQQQILCYKERTNNGDLQSCNYTERVYAQGCIKRNSIGKITFFKRNPLSIITAYNKGSFTIKGILNACHAKGCPQTLPSPPTQAVAGSIYLF